MICDSGETANPISSTNSSPVHTESGCSSNGTGSTVRNDDTDDGCKWFVLRDLSRANAKMPGYKILEEEGVRFFTPMHTVVKEKDGRKIRIREPIMKTLLFAFSTKEILNIVTLKYRTLQFRYVYGRKISDPMVVPKAEMERFIRAVESSKSEPVYYSIDEITPDKYGKEVRIAGGKLDGYTGRLLHMKGSKVKRLIVELKGLFIAGVEIEAEYLSFV